MKREHGSTTLRCVALLMSPGVARGLFFLSVFLVFVFPYEILLLIWISSGWRSLLHACLRLTGSFFVAAGWTDGGVGMGMTGCVLVPLLSV